MNDDDEGGYFNMFGGDDEEETVQEEKQEVKQSEGPKKLKHDECPLEGDPAGAKIRVMYEGQLFPATIKSYQADSNTYTISWASSGVLQYRTKPEEINWDPFVEEVVETKTEKVDEDELWLAARRGSLRSVQKFIENGIHFDETGKSQQRTPFYHAVFCGHIPVVEYLISLGARDTDDTAFITANAQVRDLLLRTGAGGKRRASIRKSITSRPPASDIQVQVNPTELEALKQLEARLETVEKASSTELRRASVAKTASAHLAAIASAVTKQQYDALKQLEERLLAVEAAMKAETRRPSLVVTKEVVGKRQSIVDQTKPTVSTQVERKKEPKVTFAEPLKKKSVNGSDKSTAIVRTDGGNKKRLNPIVRFFVAVMPKGLFGKRKARTTHS